MVLYKCKVALLNHTLVRTMASQKGAYSEKGALLREFQLGRV